MKSMFNIWYMDDGSLGGEVDILIEDFETVRRIGSTFGLQLNEHKCELVTITTRKSKEIQGHRSNNYLSRHIAN